jgi:hypothetical protein
MNNETKQFIVPPPLAQVANLRRRGKKNNYILLFIWAVLVPANVFSQASECINPADPKNYSEFKSLFQSIELGTNKDITPSLCLSKTNMFNPFSEEAYQVGYPLGIIADYRGLDLFTVEVWANNYGDGEEEWRGIELWVFKNEIFKTKILIDFGFTSEGGVYEQQFVFTKDTTLLIHSVGSLLRPITDLSLEFTFDETTKYMIDFNDTLNYRYEDQRILRAVEFSDLRYTSPYFFPEKAGSWEQYDNYPLYPTEQSPFGFYPPEHSTSLVSCWVYVREENGKYNTAIVSKDKQGNEISKMIITPKEDGHGCSYSIKNSKTTKIKMESDIKNPAIIETSVGNIMLKLNGELMTIQK